MPFTACKDQQMRTGLSVQHTYISTYVHERSVIETRQSKATTSIQHIETSFDCKKVFALPAYVHTRYVHWAAIRIHQCLLSYHSALNDDRYTLVVSDVLAQDNGMELMHPLPICQYAMFFLVCFDYNKQIVHM